MSYYFVAQIKINDNAEYQNILKHRLKAADCDTILLKGLENK